MTLAEKYLQNEMEKVAAPSEALVRLPKAGFAEKLRGWGNKVRGGQESRMDSMMAGRSAAEHSAGVRNARIQAGAGGAALLGGGALALKKLMAKKSLGQRLVGAMKKNRKALIGGGAAAGGLAGLAAYKKSQK